MHITKNILISLSMTIDKPSTMVDQTVNNLINNFEGLKVFRATFHRFMKHE